MRFLPRFELSATQLIATALAAITATVAASYLGVAGTVIGAAVVSVMSAIGNAVYAHSLRSTHARVRDAVPTRAAAVRRTNPTLTSPDAPEASASMSGEVKVVGEGEGDVRIRRGRWQRASFGAVALFVVLLTVITGVEIVTGRPISDLVRGDTGSGTTLFGDAGATSSGPAPTVTRTVTPSVVVTTPTVTQVAPAVTKTATPTVTATPSATPTPSASPTTPGPSGQPTP